VQPLSVSLVNGPFGRCRPLSSPSPAIIRAHAESQTGNVAISRRLTWHPTAPSCLTGQRLFVRDFPATNQGWPRALGARRLGRARHHRFWLPGDLAVEACSHYRSVWSMGRSGDAVRCLHPVSPSSELIRQASQEIPLLVGVWLGTRWRPRVAPASGHLTAISPPPTGFCIDHAFGV
jgi:hypothetical protein